MAFLLAYPRMQGGEGFASFCVQHMKQMNLRSFKDAILQNSVRFVSISKAIIPFFESRMFRGTK